MNSRAEIASGKSRSSTGKMDHHVDRRDEQRHVGLKVELKFSVCDVGRLVGSALCTRGANDGKREPCLGSACPGNVGSLGRMVWLSGLVIPGKIVWFLSERVKLP